MSIQLSSLCDLKTIAKAQNVLDEWTTGERSEAHFSASLYRGKFEKQLSNLEKFAASTKEAGIVPSLQQELARNARYAPPLFMY
jgi:hypothetical protein